MASIIKSTTTDGIQIIPDSTGALAIQTNGANTALTIDTSQNATFAGTLAATGKLASSSMPTGSVLQVINANLTTKVSTTSTSYIDTGLTATITPKFSTSKVLVIVSLNNIAGTANISFFKILRASTVLINNTDGGEGTTYTAFASAFNGSGRGSHGGLNYLDSPASTSALIYKVQMMTDNANSTAILNNWNLDSNAGAVSTITLMEIAV